MDIIPNKKSKLLYQKGDITNKGIIDLRCFSNENKKERREDSDTKKTVFLEIKRIAGKEKADTVQNFSKKRKHNLKKNKYNANEYLKIEKSTLSHETKSYRKQGFKFSLLWQKSFVCFTIAMIIVSFSVFSLSLIQKGIERKGEILGISTQAYENLKSAGQSASSRDFQNSIESFDSAKLNFSNTKTLIEDFGLGISGIISNLPINTPLSTAKDLVQAGEDISQAGKNTSKLLDNISQIDEGNFSANLIFQFKDDINNIAINLNSAKNNINKADLNYVPGEFQSTISQKKEELSIMANNFKNLSEDFEIITEMLGKNYPQKYLILFQNNSEIRATGGFIGSYGILDIDNGEIKNLSIDGIFNPDGQLSKKVIPPMPLQKISAAWSMHDANWFSDFPTSAKKVALFYEKTGGPTVDGVIAITPDVIEKILEITKDIEMPEYNATINKENFLTEAQLQVEELYNKEENKPKKFLSDLAPKMLEKLLNTENLDSQEKVQKYLKIINAIEDSLKEKHIIFYHRNEDIENMILRRGWGGQVLNSSGDYLRVVNTNINGYKTDAIIDEKITHSASILSDGSIIDTVSITRKHLGGNSEYDWYNRVNSDYMRVYVPLGSTLLEASGHTTQTYEAPIDYSNFETDPDIKRIEETIKIDPESKTHIFEESGKTVFGNWVYVSPGETVKVTYKYKLPYKIDFDAFTKPADKYSMLVQKQPGSKGSTYFGTIMVPDDWKIIWESQKLITENQNNSHFEEILKTDKIYGVVFSQEIKE
ncbi:MAG: DUF4012 domain-containing protein [Patescibacteria group bacterium]|nr:DUF4012 domain-containing protein [Patescibacteria group bacterium]